MLASIRQLGKESGINNIKDPVHRCNYIIKELADMEMLSESDVYSEIEHELQEARGLFEFFDTLNVYDFILWLAA